MPVDWVADVISDIMAKDEFHQGVIRLACGPDAATVGHVHDAGYEYFTAHDPVPGRLRLVGDDVDLSAADRVDQRRLADVRPPHERDEPRPVLRHGAHVTSCAWHNS